MAAPTAPKFSLGPLEGINFSTTYTAYDQTAAVSATNDPSNPGPPFGVGTHALGSDGTEYIFVKATTAVEQYSAVAISAASGAVPLTLALVLALADYGFAQVAIAAGSYGWVAIRGLGIGVLARNGSLAGKPCYISSVSAGRVTTTSVRNTSGGTLVNVVLTTSAGAAPSAATVANAPWPGTSRSAG